MKTTTKESKEPDYDDDESPTNSVSPESETYTIPRRLASKHRFVAYFE
jgi:hypothetical protein